jgi:hypothetical protein
VLAALICHTDALTDAAPPASDAELIATLTALSAVNATLNSSTYML